MSSRSPSPSKDPRKERNDALLDELCNRVCDRIDGFLEHLDVDLDRYSSRYVGACPVHGGDNRGAVSLWTDGWGGQSNWQCRTNHCQRHFSKSLLGFTHGVLSHQRHGWSREGDAKASGKLAVDEMCRYLQIDFKDLEVDPERVERRKFSRTVEILSPVRSGSGVICTRGRFLKWHEVPAPYYLGRGYSPSVLRKFDVGLCTNRKSPNFGRTIVPVHDETGEGVIGVMSRSPHPKCPRCKDCHPPAEGCRPSDEPRRRMDCRWIVDPKGFNDKHHLYNLWRARPLILKSKCIVVVEGAGDVWRLDEAGIYNAVALMGSVLGDLQDILIEECSPAHVVVLTDDDKAGDEAAEVISRKWSRLARVHRLKPEGASEVSDMSTDEVRTKFRGLIESWMRR